MKYPFSNLVQSILSKKVLPFRVIVTPDNSKVERIFIRTVVIPGGSLVTKINNRINEEPEKYTKLLFLHWQKVRKTFIKSFSLSNVNISLIIVVPIFKITVSILTECISTPYFQITNPAKWIFQILQNLFSFDSSTILLQICILSQMFYRFVLIPIVKKQVMNYF
jgi:hypothetical protein